jgi:hypothetical protein
MQPQPLNRLIFRDVLPCRGPRRIWSVRVQLRGGARRPRSYTGRAMGDPKTKDWDVDMHWSSRIRASMQWSLRQLEPVTNPSQFRQVKPQSAF